MSTPSELREAAAYAMDELDADEDAHRKYQRIFAAVCAEKADAMERGVLDCDAYLETKDENFWMQKHRYIAGDCWRAARTAAAEASKQRDEANKYMRHFEDCPRGKPVKFGEIKRKCTCGLDAFLATLDAKGGADA